MFIRFDIIQERDRQTDGQTDGHRMTAIAALMHSIAQQKVFFYSRFTLNFVTIIVKVVPTILFPETRAFHRLHQK